jgi:hypothetical protein
VEVVWVRGNWYYQPGYLEIEGYVLGKLRVLISMRACGRRQHEDDIRKILSETSCKEKPREATKNE